MSEPIIATSPEATSDIGRHRSNPHEPSAHYSLRLDNVTQGTYCVDGAHHPNLSGGSRYAGSQSAGRSTPIAIVGMGMRLPGDVRTAEEFWDFLISKRDGLCPVPPDRYNSAAFSTSKKSLPQQGYFLRQDPGCFDAPFFSIGAHEAARMDPQQRLLLEVVWECLENAGETDWEGRDIGCYVGTFGEDWLDLHHKDPQSTDRYHALGTGAFALANHVSYKFDFRGPRSVCRQCPCRQPLP